MSPIWSGRNKSTLRGGRATSVEHTREARPANRSSASRVDLRLGFGLAERKGEVGLAGQLVADQGATVRLADRVAERGHLDLQSQAVAGPDLLAESAIVDARKQQRLVAVGRVLHDQHRARLRKRFHNEHTRHDRILREVSTQKVISLETHFLQTDNMLA